METLIINIPERKSTLVKQLLKEMGVTMRKATEAKKKPSDFAGMMSRERANEFLQHIEEGRKEWERDI